MLRRQPNGVAMGAGEIRRSDGRLPRRIAGANGANVPTVVLRSAPRRAARRRRPPVSADSEAVGFEVARGCRRPVGHGITAGGMILMAPTVWIAIRFSHPAEPVPRAAATSTSRRLSRGTAVERLAVSAPRPGHRSRHDAGEPDDDHWYLSLLAPTSAAVRRTRRACPAHSTDSTAASAITAATPGDAMLTRMERIDDEAADR